MWSALQYGGQAKSKPAVTGPSVPGMTLLLMMSELTHKFMFLSLDCDWCIVQQQSHKEFWIDSGGWPFRWPRQNFVIQGMRSTSRELLEATSQDWHTINNLNRISETWNRKFHSTQRLAVWPNTFGNLFTSNSCFLVYRKLKLIDEMLYSQHCSTISIPLQSIIFHLQFVLLEDLCFSNQLHVRLHRRTPGPLSPHFVHQFRQRMISAFCILQFFSTLTVISQRFLSH